jgi:hypothetical protein
MMMKKMNMKSMDGCNDTSDIAPLVDAPLVEVDNTQVHPGPTELSDHIEPLKEQVSEPQATLELEAHASTFRPHRDKMKLNWVEYGALSRPHENKDVAFIKSSWLNSFRQSPSVAGITLGQDSRMVVAETSTVSKLGVKPIIRKNPMPLVSSQRTIISAGCTDSIYFYEMSALIDMILKRTRAEIAYFAEDPSIILGWALVELVDNIPVIQWTYTKERFRGTKICSTLLERCGVTEGKEAFFTHMPPPTFDRDGFVVSWWRNEWIKRKGWVYDPWINIFVGRKEDENKG